MIYKHDGWFRDGSTMCVYGYDKSGCRVALFKGYYNHRTDMIKLYPVKRVAATTERIEKTTIHISELKK